MTGRCLVAGRQAFACAAVALLAFASTAGSRATEAFPFEQELVLEVKPMTPIKRVPVLSVETNGRARIDLWCRTASAQVELADRAIRIEPLPLPDTLPRYMRDGQCTTERMQADEDMLATLAQMNSWRVEGSAVVLSGPTTLRFRVSTH
jgi:heat shock protein HslJ